MDIEKLDFSTIKIVDHEIPELTRECEIELMKEIKEHIPYLRACGKLSSIAENKILKALNMEINY